MVEFLDLRSVRYYKIKQGILQQNLSRNYRFESADVLCKQFNIFVNILKKEKEKTKERYSMLEQDGENRNMSDREILDKYIDIENSCLSDSEKKQVIDMLYEYKDTFILRDEIGTCLNIEVEIDVTYMSPFLLGHVMLRRKIRVYWARR